MQKKTTKAAKEALSEFSRKGGQAIAKKLGNKGMSELGKRGAAKRWPKAKDKK